MGKLVGLMKSDVCVVLTPHAFNKEIILSAGTYRSLFIAGFGGFFSHLIYLELWEIGWNYMFELRTFLIEFI